MSFDEFLKDMKFDNIDFGILTDEEKKALEHEFTKIMYIYKLAADKKVDIFSVFSKDMVGDMVKEANDFLISEQMQRHKKENMEAFRGKPARSKEAPKKEGDTIFVEVMDDVARTYDHKDYLRELNLRYVKDKKAWVGPLTKDEIDELKNAGLAVKEV